MYKHLICPLMGGTNPKTVTQIKLLWLLSCRGETTLRTETVMIDFFFLLAGLGKAVELSFCLWL